MSFKIAKSTIVTHTKSEDFEETITIKIHDDDSVTKSINSVLDCFNDLEKERSKKFKNYPCGEVRSLKEIVSVDFLEDNKTVNWHKLSEYFDSVTVFECKNTGLFALADWWPQEVVVGKHICKICNSHFLNKGDYRHHFTGDKHIYCERNNDTHRVYFSKSLEKYLNKKYEEKHEALINKENTK